MGQLPDGEFELVPMPGVLQLGWEPGRNSAPSPSYFYGYYLGLKQYRRTYCKVECVHWFTKLWQKIINLVQPEWKLL